MKPKTPLSYKLKEVQPFFNIINIINIDCNSKIVLSFGNFVHMNPSIKKALCK